MESAINFIWMQWIMYVFNHSIDYLISSFLDESGIVSSLSTILSKAGIQIIYLSTSITDYILVPSYKINDAVKVLQEHGKVLNEPLFEFDNLDNMDRYIDSEKTVFSLKQMFEEFSTPSTIQTIPKPPFECNLLPDRLILCRYGF